VPSSTISIGKKNASCSSIAVYALPPNTGQVHSSQNKLSPNIPHIEAPCYISGSSASDNFVAYTYSHLCVCVCVCEREREREGDHRGWQKIARETHYPVSSIVVG
jgi:hypothetical protein